MLEISNPQFNSNEIEKKVYSLKIIHTPKVAKILAYWLVGILLFLFLCLFLPWQQNVDGSGSVTALSPSDRPQEVNTGHRRKNKILECTRGAICEQRRYTGYFGRNQN